MDGPRLFLAAFSSPAVNGTSINGDEINCSGNFPLGFKCLVFLKPGVSHVCYTCLLGKQEFLTLSQAERVFSSGERVQMLSGFILTGCNGAMKSNWTIAGPLIPLC